MSAATEERWPIASFTADDFKPENGNVDVRIRWFTKNDIPEMLEIEQACFSARSWTEEDFLSCLHGNNTIGMVATSNADDRVVGFMIYDLQESQRLLLSLAVAPEEQRLGVGTALIEYLKWRINPRRPEVQLALRESNLAAQLFFKSAQFRATAVFSDYFPDGEDAYVMRFKKEFL